YRRYNLGNIAGRWQTAGRIVHAAGSVQSDHGSVAVDGDATLPASDPLRDMRARTALTARATVADLDLARWLPAAGITLPVLGTVNASARASGTLAAPSFDGTAAVTNGFVRGYSLSSFTLAASGDARGARLTALHLTGSGLTADASGSFGY